MEALFRRDVAAAEAIEAAAWQRRGWRERLMEHLGRWTERLL
jgi:hypothetical protein